MTKNLIELESLIIHGIILSDTPEEYVFTLKESDFNSELHIYIWGLVCRRVKNSKGVDFHSLKADAAYSNYTNMKEINEFFNKPLSVTSNELQNLIETLVTYSKRNELKKIAYKLVQESNDTKHEITEITNNTLKALSNIESRGENDSSKTYKDIAPKLIEQMRERALAGTDLVGLDTGHPELNTITRGFRDTKLIVIAARPAMGKTTFALNVADLCCEKGGRGLIFSLEMPQDELLARSIANIGNIKQDHILTGNLSEKELHDFKIAIEKTDQFDLIVHDEDIDINGVKIKARKLNRQKKLSFILVDYLQLMKIGKGTKNDEYGIITGELKKLAKELGCPIIALSQLSRDVEKRQDKRPINSDLRDSGSIEQDADLIIFIYRDEVYNPDTLDKGLAEIIISKQRDGTLGTVKTIFQGEYSRFKPIENNN